MSTDPASLRAEFWSLPTTARVDRHTVAAAAYLSIASLELMAIKGGGPAYSRVGRKALYLKSDVVDWLNSGRRVTSTSQLTAAA